MANEVEKGRVRHEGIVDAVTEDGVRVRIAQPSACSSCASSDNCRTAGCRERLVDVKPVSSNYREGERVVVSMSRHAGKVSVLLAFVAPFLLILLLIFSVWSFTKDERWAALAGILGVVLYYGVLSLFRKRIADTISFKLEEVN